MPHAVALLGAFGAVPPAEVADEVAGDAADTHERPAAAQVGAAELGRVVGRADDHEVGAELAGATAQPLDGERVQGRDAWGELDVGESGER